MSNGQTPTYTAWERLDPNSRNQNLTGALQMRLGDPLWLLARQHQFGEFEGEDAGSPTQAEVKYVQDLTSRVRLGPNGEPGTEDSEERHSVVQTYDPTQAPPLETLIEREPAAARSDSGPPLRLRIEAGMNFLDRLHRKIKENEDSSNQSDLPAPTDFPRRFYPSDPDLSNEAGRRFASIFQAGGGDQEEGAPRALDGHEVYLVLTDVPGLCNGEPRWSELAGDRELPVPETYSTSSLKEVASEFVSWYRNLYDEPEDAHDTWNPERLEYEAAVSTGAEDTETVFEVEEYSGGRLDWYDFAPRNGDASLFDAGGEQSTDRSLSGKEHFEELPTQMKFRGQPASRLWEMEDADINLSAISAAENDLARLFLLEYTLLSGDNWYSLPLEVPVGSLTRIANLEITDTFGRKTTVVPPGQQSGEDNWSMFTFDLPNPSDDRESEERESAPGLYLPPVVGDLMSTDPVERVQFARDQMANLLFGIEERFEGPLGHPIDRSTFSLPVLEITDLHPAPDPDDEYIEFTNQGDDQLDVGNFVVVLDSEDSTGSSVKLEFGPSKKFINKGESVRLYIGGSQNRDTSDRLHAGRDASLLTTEEDSEVVPRDAVVEVHEDGKLVLREPIRASERPELERYRIASEVADHWFPFTLQGNKFHLALLLDASVQSGSLEALPRPRGRILDPSTPIKEEEVSRGGLRVDRTYQLARSIAGNRHLWTGRDVDVGTGEESSGLRFDFLVPPEEE